MLYKFLGFFNFIVSYCLLFSLSIVNNSPAVDLPQNGETLSCQNIFREMWKMWQSQHVTLLTSVQYMKCLLIGMHTSVPFRIWNNRTPIEIWEPWKSWMTTVPENVNIWSESLLHVAYTPVLSSWWSFCNRNESNIYTRSLHVCNSRTFVRTHSNWVQRLLWVISKSGQSRVPSVDGDVQI